MQFGTETWSMAGKRRRKPSLQVCALIFEGQQLESSPPGPESDAAKEQEVRGPGTNLQRMSYATLSKSASQRLFLIWRKEDGAGALCGGGNALLWGPMSVLEIVLSTVNMIVNKRNRGLALLVMLVMLRSEQTITV